MTNLIPYTLLIGALIAGYSQEPVMPAPQVTIRCERSGSVEVSQDAVRITCDRADLRIRPSSIRNITVTTEARVAIPIGPMSAIPVGRRRHLLLYYLGDDREHAVPLRVNQDDLIPGIAALHRLTQLPVFTGRLYDDLTAAGVLQTVGRYAISLPSADQRASVDDRQARFAAVTESGDVIVLYASGRSAVWNPATNAVHPLGPARFSLEPPRWCAFVSVLEIHQRTAILPSCDWVEVYDLDTGALHAEIPLEHPLRVALNRSDGGLYWIESGKLHRRSLTDEATEHPATPLPGKCDRLAFSPPGDLMFCGNDDALYIYKFDQGGAGALVKKIRGWYAPSTFAIHPQGTRFLTHHQPLVPSFLSSREIVTIWDLQPAPKKVREVRLPKGLPQQLHPTLRYSADGSIVVLSASRSFTIDPETGKILCHVSQGVRSISRPNAQGLSAGIRWMPGELDRVVVWDTSTCEIRSTLAPPK